MSTDVAPQRLRILVAVDGGEASERAAIAAHRLFGNDADFLLITVGASPDGGGRGDSSLTDGLGLDPLISSGPGVLSVASTDDRRRHTQETVADEALLDHPESLSAVGDVATTIVQAAHEHGADVIVIGSHDRSWFSRLFDPSTSRHIIGASDLPVVVVKDATPSDAPSPDHLVMIAADGSTQSRHAAWTARRLFGPHARYEVVHVAPDRPDPNADADGFAGPLIDDEEADEIYRETVADADALVAATAGEIGPVPVAQTVLFGDPVHRLCEWARDAPADLLVIGSTGASGFQHVLLGSVSEHVVAHCAVPVLVVPNAV